MLSKFLRPVLALRPMLYASKVKSPHKIWSRSSSDYIPPDQYDIPIPRRLNLIYVMTVYWEIIPMFFVTALSFTLCFIACTWAVFNKVDVVFSTHNRETISRTMNLRQPSIHKMITITVRWPPWPEMQDVLDKMKQAEKRALARAQSCAHA